MNNPPTVVKWKDVVRNSVASFWNKKLKDEAKEMKSVKNLNLDMCGIGYSHPVWVCGSDPIQAIMANAKANLLVGRYPLTGSKCAGQLYSHVYTLCNLECETVQHFLLQCPSLEAIRTQYLQQLHQYLPQNIFKEDLMKYIIDPSHLPISTADLFKVENITRRLCFSLHNRRCILMGAGSAMSRALKWVKQNGANKQAKFKVPTTQKWGSPA